MTVEQPIRRVVEDLVAAWNRRDGAAFSRLFAENADYVTGSGVRLVGRDQIHRSLFIRGSDPIESGRVSLSIDAIKTLGSDAAVLLCAWQMDPGAARQSDGLGVRAGFVTIVMQRAPDTWQIVALQNTDKTP